MGNRARLCYLGTMKTIRFRTIAVRLEATAAAGQEYSLNDQEDLKTAIIDGIETFTASDTTHSVEGLPVVTDADAVRLCVFYAEDSTDKAKAVPYMPQRSSINSGIVREYDKMVLTFPNCRVRVVETLDGDVQYALIGVHYHFPKDIVR